MDTAPAGSGPDAMVERLRQAVNAHDLAALVDCFAVGYRSETPAHPERGFIGREQVRRNWEQIFGAIQDLTVDVVQSAVDGDTIWTEWEHRGTRPDGSAHLMRGVVIFGVTEGLAGWGRLYLEPVQEDGDDADTAVRRQVAPGGTP